MMSAAKVAKVIEHWETLEELWQLRAYIDALCFTETDQGRCDMLQCMEDRIDKVIARIHGEFHEELS